MSQTISEILYDDYSAYINSSYPDFLKRLNLNLPAANAEGAMITDSSGKIYIDCVGGFGIHNFGHNNPELKKALSEQIEKNELFTGPLISALQVETQKLLAEFVPGKPECSFLLNSGSEAVDAAIKLARLNSTGKKIISFENSFYGHTFGALSACGIHRFRTAFGPLIPEIEIIPYGDIEALKKTIDKNTAAVLIEPIQHEAGVYIPEKNFMNELRELCDTNDCLLIFDEIKTGLGRTGYKFAFEFFNVQPDILILGKSLGGGLIPAGAIIARKELWKRFSFSFPMSASSYSGNVFLCSIIKKILSYFSKSDFLEEVRKKSNYLITSLESLQKKFPHFIKSVKGIGLLIGVETTSGEHCFKICRSLINQGVLVFPAFGNNSIFMIEPPLIISEENIEKICVALKRTLIEF